MDMSKNEVLAALVTELGGVTKLASTCGVTESAVRHWIRKGRVPTTAAYLLHVLYPGYAITDLTGK